MFLSTSQSIIMILVIAFGTLITRALPFILFPDNKEVPGYIKYLGDVIPFAAIGMLIIYCLKGVSLFNAPYGLPEAAAISAVILIHLWKNNTFLSIGAGTLIYMLLVQYVFV